MNPITIEAGAYARAALEVLRSGGMGFQSETNRRAGACRYLYEDGARCAIGAGLPVERLERLDAFQICSPVGALLRTGVVAVTSAVMPQAELRPLLGKIQATHDGLMIRGLKPERMPEMVATLTALLEELSERHPERRETAG